MTFLDFIRLYWILLDIIRYTQMMTDRPQRLELAGGDGYLKLRTVGHKSFYDIIKD